MTNCKDELSLRWIENCVLTTHENNAKLSKLLGEGFKRSICWNKYKVIGNLVVEIAADNEEKYIRELLDSSYQGVEKLFFLAYDNTAGDDHVSVDSFKKYFLPRVKVQNYNIEIDVRNFYDQPINDSMKQYSEIRKISTGQGDDYTTGCLLDFSYFEKNYKLIAVDLSKQKALDADSRAIQQTIFTGKIKTAADNTRVITCYILEQPKEAILEISKGTAKVS